MKNFTYSFCKITIFLSNIQIKSKKEKNNWKKNMPHSIHIYYDFESDTKIGISPPPSEHLSKPLYSLTNKH